MSGPTLAEALRWGDVEHAGVLVRRSPASAHDADEWGTPPLHLAVTLGSLEAVELLLGAGADPDAIDADGESAWVKASLFDDAPPLPPPLAREFGPPLAPVPDLAARLRAAGAQEDPTALARGRARRQALLRAMKARDRSASGAALGWGGDLHRLSPDRSVLLELALQRDVEGLRWALGLGADPNTRLRVPLLYQAAASLGDGFASLVAGGACHPGAVPGRDMLDFITDSNLPIRVVTELCRVGAPVPEHTWRVLREFAPIQHAQLLADDPEPPKRDFLAAEWAGMLVDLPAGPLSYGREGRAWRVGMRGRQPVVFTDEGEVRSDLPVAWPTDDLRAVFRAASGWRRFRKGVERGEFYQLQEHRQAMREGVRYTASRLEAPMAQPVSRAFLEATRWWSPDAGVLSLDNQGFVTESGERFALEGDRWVRVLHPARVPPERRAELLPKLHDNFDPGAEPVLLPEDPDATEEPLPALAALALEKVEAIRRTRGYVDAPDEGPVRVYVMELPELEVRAVIRLDPGARAWWSVHPMGDGFGAPMRLGDVPPEAYCTMRQRRDAWVALYTRP